MQSYKPKEWVNKTSSNAAIPAQTQAATSVDNIDSSAYFKTGVVSSAAGSSYYEFGGTKVICAVYGPLPSLKAQSFDRGVLVCEFEFAPFASSSITSASASASSSSGAAVSAVAAGPGAVINASASASAGTAGRRRRGGRQDPEESLNASMLHDALSVAVRLDRFPKHEVRHLYRLHCTITLIAWPLPLHCYFDYMVTICLFFTTSASHIPSISLSICPLQVQVLVQVLERNGGELAAAINAAVVALADSGIEMLDLAAAATVVRLSPVSFMKSILVIPYHISLNLLTLALVTPHLLLSIYRLTTRRPA